MKKEKTIYKIKYNLQDFIQHFTLVKVTLRTLEFWRPTVCFFFFMNRGGKENQSWRLREGVSKWNVKK